MQRAIEARRYGGRRVGEGAAERDHLPDVVGEASRHLARVDSPEAPADDADTPVVSRAQRVEPLPHTQDDRLGGADVATELPPVDVVAAAAEKPAQHAGGDVAGEEAGEDEHRVPVAGGRAIEDRQRGQDARQLEQGAALEGGEEGRRRCEDGIGHQAGIHHRLMSSAIASTGSARSDSSPPYVPATAQRPFSSR